MPSVPEMFFQETVSRDSVSVDTDGKLFHCSCLCLCHMKYYRANSPGGQNFSEEIWISTFGEAKKKKLSSAIN